VTGGFNIELALNPTGASLINQTFRVDVTLDNDTEIDGARIYRVVIKEGDFTTSKCTLIEQPSTTTGDYAVNIPFGSSNLKTLEFRCSAAGTYKITVYANIPNTNYFADNITPDKVITPPSGFYAEIISPTDGSYYKINDNLFLNSEIYGLGPSEIPRCSWSSLNLNTSETKVISQNCKEFIRVSEYFEVGNTYNISLSVINNAEEQATAGPNNITIIDDSSYILSFSPENHSVVNNYFTTRFLSKFQITNPINITAPNCNFTGINFRPIIVDVSPNSSSHSTYYAYDFKSICSRDGLKTVNATTGLTNIQKNYLIIPLFTELESKHLDLLVYLDNSGATGTISYQDQDIKLEGKEPDKLYFAEGDNILPRDYQLNRNQRFMVYPIFESQIGNESIPVSNATCYILLSPETAGSGPTYSRHIPCNSAANFRVQGSGRYNLKITAYHTSTYNLNKIINFNNIPFSITSVKPNNEIVNKGLVPFEVFLDNIGTLPLTVDINLYKKEPFLDQINFASKKEESKLYFAGEEGAESNSSYEQMQLYGSFTCNDNYTYCTKNINLTEEGDYVGKVVAKQQGNSGLQTAQTEIINFKVVRSPDGLIIMGQSHINIGTKNDYFALFYYVDEENNTHAYFPLSNSCNWQTSQPTINPISGNCVFTITPATLSDNTLTVSAKDFSNTLHNGTPKTIHISEDTRVVYPYSVIELDTNTANEYYGVHYKNTKIKLDALQREPNNTFGPMLPNFRCSWKYKLSSASNWTNLGDANCNEGMLIPDSENLGVNTYNVHLDVKYNSAIIYSKDSSFKIRECLVVGEKCQYNGLCESDYTCSYLRFPGVSMDLAKNYVTATGDSYLRNFWQRTPFSGIGHSLITDEITHSESTGFGATIYKSDSVSNAQATGLVNSTINYESNKCSSSVSVSPFIKVNSTGDPFIFNVFAIKNAYAPNYISNRDISFVAEYPGFGYSNNLIGGLYFELNDNDGAPYRLVESTFHNQISETSQVTFISAGVAADNYTEYSNSGNYDNVDFKLTKLIYYSLNDNIYIRKFAIINCNGTLNNNSNTTTENCNSPITFAYINSKLSGGKSLSTFTKDGQNYNYYYDYPQIQRENNKLAIVGTRYAINPDSGGDFNIQSLETYILYTPNIEENNIWKLYITDDPKFSPMEPRGSTLLFDSDGKLHYSFISGASQLVKDSKNYLRFTNALNYGISQPMELVFDPVTEDIKIETIFPNPGTNNSQFAYFFGKENNATYLAQPYGSTIVNTGQDRPTEIYSNYSQQAIHPEENWMVQIWTSYPIVEEYYQYSGHHMVNGEVNQKILNASFSNDNGKHWTAPVSLISTVADDLTAVLNFGKAGYKGYFSISKYITKINDDVGRFGLVYTSYYKPNLNYYTNTFYEENTLDQSVYHFDVNFGDLIITNGNKEFGEYLIKDSAGNLVNTKAGSINYYTYRKPYIVSKISNDNNLYDDVYINANCAAFNNTSQGWIEYNDLTSKTCVLQLEQIYEPQLLNVIDGQNDDDYGCGGTHTGAGPGYGGNVCFKAGTKVYTPNGHVNIEDIKSGDKVYSLDEETKEIVITTVKTPIIHKNQKSALTPKLYKIGLSNGVKLFVTENHSFYISNIKDYKQLVQITSNDDLLYYNQKTNEFEEVRIITKELQEEEETYYNLSLIENHNYLAEGIVVHNDRKHTVNPYMPPSPCTDGCSYFTWFDMMNLINGWANSSTITNYTFTDITVTDTMSAVFNDAINLGGGHFILSVDWPDGTSGFGYYNSNTGQVFGYNLGNLGAPLGGSIVCVAC